MVDRELYSRDPLYNWLVGEIQQVFGFLNEVFFFTLDAVEADLRGCWLTYVRDGTRVQIWAEMGRRPEVDLIENGRRRSLKALIADRWPDRELPTRPGYIGLEGENRDFSAVLSTYSTVLNDFLSAVPRRNSIRNSKGPKNDE